MTRWRLALGVLISVFVASACLQAQSSTTGAVGETLGLGLPPDGGEDNFLVAGVSLSSILTDNVLLSSGHPLTDIDYAVQPSLSIAKRFGWLRTKWDVSPALVKYQRIGQRDRLTGTAIADIEARPWERWLIRVSNAYQVQTNPPFDTLTTEPQSRFFQGEGGGTILPLAGQTSEDGTVDISYKASESTTLQLSGFYHDYLFHAVPGLNISSSLANSQSKVGRAQVYKRLSRRAYLGVAYSLQDIGFSFQDHTAGVLSQSLIGVATYEIRPDMQIQFFGGPGYSRIHNQILLNLGILSLFIPVTETVASPTGGVVYAVQKNRTSLQLAGVRQVSGGTGLTAGVQSTNADFMVRRKLYSRWYGEVGGSYGLFTPLGQTSTSFNIRALSGRIALTRQLSEHLSIELNFSRGHEQETTAAIRSRVDADFAMISLKYQVKKPIG